MTWALAAVSAALAIWGVLRTAADAHDHGFLTGFLLVGTPAIPAAWACLRVLLPQYSPRSPVMTSLLRCITVPLAVGWLPAIAVTITLHLPWISTRIAETQGEHGQRYFFGEDDGSLLLQGLWLGGLIGVAVGVLTGLVLSVFIVLPVLAWSRPRDTAEENMLMTSSPEQQRAATFAIRALSVLIMLIFAVPTFIVWGGSEARAQSLWAAFPNALAFFGDPGRYWGDLMWVVGVLLAPVAIIVLVLVKLSQRPDIARRAAHGVNAPGDQQRYAREFEDREPE